MLAKKSWLWMIPILLMVAFVAMANANSNMLWFDEIYTNLFAGVMPFDAPRIPHTLLDSVLLVITTDAWPPLYYIVFRYWFMLTGASVFSQAYLSILYGFISTSLIYVLGKRLFGTKGGIIAAALFGGSAFLAYYFHEIRGYSQLILSIILSIYMYWRLLHERNFMKKRWSWGFSLSVAFVLYTFSSSGIYLLGLIAYHFLFEWPSRSQTPNMNSKRWWDIARAWFNGCLIFAPYLGVLYRTVEGETKIDRSMPFIDLVQRTLYLFSDNLAWMVLPLLVLGLWYAKKREVRFLWFMFIFSFILLLIVNAAILFIFHPRHIIGLFPIFVLMLTAGFLQLERYNRPFAWSLLGIWLGVGMVYGFLPSFMDAVPSHERGFPSATHQGIEEVIATCVTQDDSMVFAVDRPELVDSYNQILLYYYSQTGIFYAQVFHYILPDALDLERMQNEMGESPQVWLMSRPNIGLDPELMRFDDALQSLGYESCGIVRDANELEVWAYSTESCEAVVQSCQP